MRIISGKARGRKLLSPEGYGTTRPTLDRIKEAIFNIIQFDVPGSKTIDLFSGTGSLGLEAASRGAEKCILIDKSPETFKYLVQNVNNLGFTDICECFNMEYNVVLDKIKEKNIVLDLIFIDPPYFKGLIPPAIDKITEYELLDKNGLIVTKIDSEEPIYEGNEKIILVDKRKYGNTTVCFYRFK
jgi:16S rRNA (guanine(966)-N(2))-methyltransferase RsmD